MTTPTARSPTRRTTPTRVRLVSLAVCALALAATALILEHRARTATETSLARDLSAGAALVEEFCSTSRAQLAVTARLLAAQPALQAAVSARDARAATSLAEGFRDRSDAHWLLITDQSSAVLTSWGATPRESAVVARQPAIRRARDGTEQTMMLPQPDGVLQVVTVAVAAPAGLGGEAGRAAGTLSVGRLLDRAVAARLKGASGSDFAFVVDRQVLASSLVPDSPALLRELTTGERRAQRDRWTSYRALLQPLADVPDGVPTGSGPAALVLRARSDDAAWFNLSALMLVAIAGAAMLGVAWKTWGSGSFRAG